MLNEREKGENKKKDLLKLPTADSKTFISVVYCRI